MRSVTIAFAAMLLASLGVATAQAQDGSIVAWGDNTYGSCSVPEPNASFVAIEGGSAHGLGLKTDGSVVAWGLNQYGQCDVPTPNNSIAAIAGGSYHSLGLKTDGSIVAWGWNEHGQCTIPLPNADFVAVSGGGWHTLGLKSDGSIVAWGGNIWGECNVPSPDSGFVAVAAGGAHSLGLRSDGTIVAWGANYYGEGNVPSPNAGFVAVAAGASHNLGLKTDGSIVAWGWNEYGQCSVPTPNNGFVAVAGGQEHSLGLKADGSIVAWGRNDHGQCDVPSSGYSFVALTGGVLYSLGLTARIGACCQSSGTCTVTTDETCPESSIWQGAGTACNPNPCLSGACCLRSAPGTCEIDTPARCASINGFYFGSGTLCAPSDTCWTTGVDGTSRVVMRLQVHTSPNPSAGGVVIHCLLPLHTPATVEIFDASGRFVRRLHEGELPAGETPLSWDGRDVPAGVYLVRISTPAGSADGRVVVAR